jgi:hypothetical protein
MNLKLPPFFAFLIKALPNKKMKEATCMGIELAIILLTYVTILVMSYMVIICLKDKDERGIRIINRAYQNAYSILLFSILVVIALIKLPHITLTNQTTSYLILTSKFISVITLGGSIFLLNRNK